MLFISIGQTKPVHVYQLIAENTVESKVMDIVVGMQPSLTLCITFPGH